MCMAIIATLKYRLDAGRLPILVKFSLVNSYIGTKTVVGKINLNELPDQSYLLRKRKLIGSSG